MRARKSLTMPIGVVALTFACSSPTLADQIHGPTGGNGGTYFSARCDQGSIMTGVSILAAEAIIAVTPICAVAASPTALKAASVADYPKRFGGSRGERIDLTCTAQRPAMRGLYTQSYRAHDVRSEIGIYCGTADGNARTIDGTAATAEWRGQKEVRKGGIFGADDPFIGTHGYDLCKGNDVVVGLVGRSGAAVDALGIICGAPQIAKAAPPPGYTIGTGRTISGTRDTSRAATVGAGKTDPKPPR